MEQRRIARESLYVMAGLRLAGKDHRVKLRNLSPGGVMVEGDIRVVIGTEVEVEVRNIGWVKGTVAWVQDNRCGIGFVEEIDPTAIRASAGSSNEVPDFYVRRPLAAAKHSLGTDPHRLRKI